MARPGRRSPPRSCSATAQREAIALNGAVFQATRLIGPAVASLLIARVGPGWVFAVNAACYLGPSIGLLRLRPADLAPAPAAIHEPRALRTAARYVRGRPEVLRTLFLVGMVGTFGLNFPIVLTAMAKSTFHGSASTYGLFNIVLAIGSVAGALLAGAAGRPPRHVIVIAAAVFGLLQAAAAAAPDLAVFLSLLAGMGFTNLAFQATANASVQLCVDPGLRGRVMGLYMLVFIGGTPIGAPVIGHMLTNAPRRLGRHGHLRWHSRAGRSPGRRGRETPKARAAGFRTSGAARSQESPR